MIHRADDPDLTRQRLNTKLCGQMMISHKKFGQMGRKHTLVHNPEHLPTIVK